jgi:hypothetical protein
LFSKLDLNTNSTLLRRWRKGESEIVAFLHLPLSRGQDGDLGLRGWQSIGGFLLFRVVRIDNLDQVLLITHSYIAELFLLYCKLFLLLHYYGSPFYYHSSLLQLPLLKTLSRTISRSILQLFWSATGTFSTLGLVRWYFDRARTWEGRFTGR